MEIKLARSVDGGSTFGAPASLQSTGAAGDRGWHSLTLDDRGVAHVLWLAHAPGRAGQAHALPGDGVDRQRRGSGVDVGLAGCQRDPRATTGRGWSSHERPTLGA